MFIPKESRPAGETFTTPVPQDKIDKPWVLFVYSSIELQICMPGELGCMGNIHLEIISRVVQLPFLYVESLFLSVSKTGKPEVLKMGTENEMRTLCGALQLFACSCMFHIEVVQSK